MLESEGIKLSHSLGQNFLVNSAIIEKTLKLAEANSNDTILEVGPGIGALTVPLLETGANVVAIEKDQRLKGLLLKNTEFAKDRFTLIEGDALKVLSQSNCSQDEFLKEGLFSIASENAASNLSAGCPRSFHFPNESVTCGCNKLIANLPYNIAATLVLNVFQSSFMAAINYLGDRRTKKDQREACLGEQICTKEGRASLRAASSSCSAKMPSRMLRSVTVMVQREVADRMCATVGSKNYGAYTVKLSLFAEVQDQFFVGRNNFLPAPRVDSAVIRLNRIDRGLPDEVLQNACKAADAAFLNRRKTILNSCKAYFGCDSEKIKHWLGLCNIDPKIRGEKLTTDDFINLGKNLPA